MSTSTTVDLDRGKFGDEGHFVTIEGRAVFIKDDIGTGAKGRGGKFTRHAVEKRLIDHHERHGGGDANSREHDRMQEASGGKAFVFHKSLPTEVKEYIDENPAARRLFTVTHDSARAGGEDAMHHHGDRYWQMADELAGNHAKAARETAKGSDDPEMRFLAHLHDDMEAGGTHKGQQGILQAEHLRHGQSFTINGRKFTVEDDPDEGMILDGGHGFPTTPVAALSEIPIDRHSLKAGSRPKTKPNDDIPFSRADVRELLGLSQGNLFGTSGIGHQGGLFKTGNDGKAKANLEDGHWVTIHGVHVFIHHGESVGHALRSHFKGSDKPTTHEHVGDAARQISKQGGRPHVEPDDMRPSDAPAAAEPPARPLPIVAPAGQDTEGVDRTADAPTARDKARQAAEDAMRRRYEEKVEQARAAKADDYTNAAQNDRLTKLLADGWKFEGTGNQSHYVRSPDGSVVERIGAGGANQHHMTGQRWDEGGKDRALAKPQPLTPEEAKGRRVIEMVGPTGMARDDKKADIGAFVRVHENIDEAMKHITAGLKIHKPAIVERLLSGKPFGVISRLYQLEGTPGAVAVPTPAATTAAAAPVDTNRQLGIFAKDANGNAVEVGEKVGQGSLFGNTAKPPAAPAAPVDPDAKLRAKFDEKATPSMFGNAGGKPTPDPKVIADYDRRIASVQKAIASRVAVASTPPPASVDPMFRRAPTDAAGREWMRSRTELADLNAHHENLVKMRDGYAAGTHDAHGVRLGTATHAAEAAAAAIGKEAAQQVTQKPFRDDEHIIVRGNTYPHRDKLIAAGFGWNKNKKEWTGRHGNLPAGLDGITKHHVYDEGGAVFSGPLTPEQLGLKAAEAVTKNKPAGAIADFGEVIPGARKMTAVATGPRAAKEKVEDTRPTWLKRYNIGEDATKPGEFFISDTKTNELVRHPGTYRVRNYASREEAHAALVDHEVDRTLRVHSENRPDGGQDYGVYRRNSAGNTAKIIGGFATREAAESHLKANKESLLAHKFEDPKRPYLDRVERTGAMHRGGDVKPADFQEAFKFRGGQFGNWQTNGDGQASLNHAYDALHDLSSITGIEPADLSLGGKLAIAFGARGTGGKDSAAAHYEPELKVVNLTKMNGAGSLAHELWHAIDHHLGEKFGAPGSFAIESHRGSKYPAELKEAFAAVHTAIHDKHEIRPRDVEASKKRVEDATKELADRIRDIENTHQAYIRWSNEGRRGGRKARPFMPSEQAKWDAAKAKLLAGEPGEEAWRMSANARSLTGYNAHEQSEVMNKLYKDAVGKSFHDSSRKSHGDYLRSNINRLARVKNDHQAAIGGEGEKVRMRTDFVRRAQDLDRRHVNAYFSTPTELAARAFESYVEDKLHERGHKSQYLVHGTRSGLYSLLLMPQAGERQNINAAFDRLLTVARKHIGEKSPADAGTALARDDGDDRFYLSAAGEMRPVLTLGSALPKSHNELPVHYRWVDAAAVDNWVHPRTGAKVDISEPRIDKWVNGIKLARSRGVDLPVCEDHKEEARKSLGAIYDAKRDGKRLSLLLGFYGDDSLNVARKNKLSVGIDLNFKDSYGNRYGEMIRHVAATPIPVIHNQQGFIGASRSQPAEPVFLSLAASQQEALCH